MVARILHQKELNGEGVSVEMEALVSVIIPTYKGSDKIERAVDSAMSQTYPNIEVIVVDDNGAGTVEQLLTAEKVEKYRKHENFVYVVHDVNKNGSAARNSGVKKAKGYYLCFLDDDDVFLPQKTELQVRKLRSMPAEYGMVFGSVDEIVSTDVLRHYRADFSGDFLYQFLCGKLFACSSTVMITRQALEEVGDWDESFCRHQDWEYFSRVASRYQVTYVPETCVLKNRYDQNLPKDGAIAEQYRLHFLEKMKPIIEKYELHQIRTIRDHHLTQVGKVYLKNKNLKDAMRIAWSTSNAVKTLLTYGKDGFVYLTRRK